MGVWSKLYMLLGDILIITLSYFFAYLLRFDGHIPDKYLYGYLLIIIPVILLSLVVFRFNGLYNRLWRYAGEAEIVDIVKAVSFSVTGAVVVSYFVPSVIPRSIPILSWMLLLLLVGASRFGIRLLFSYQGHQLRLTKDARRICIVGAGDAGVTVAKELLNNQNGNMIPIGFVDDDPTKQGLQLLGLEVLGKSDDILSIVNELEIDEIVIAIPSATGEVIRKLVSKCKSTDAEVKILPSVYDLIQGKVYVSQIRKVQLEDLLGREPVIIDLDKVSSEIKGKVILVTGAAGSIGSELCRQICKFRPKLLVLCDISENGLFDMENEIERTYPDQDICIELTDIKDEVKIDQIMKTYYPEVVYHAAAHKHVPMMERNPEEALRNNVWGTKNLAGAAVRYGVKKLIFISTDKAVNPTSIMGASKRLAEMIIQHFNRISDTSFVSVRFGNVLGSRGSVIPFFNQQIANGGPVTVTHPDMQRYFMTIPEAVQLVLQAGALNGEGEIFVLDMGKPVKIVDLARDLIRLSGFEPDRDIKIEISGTRPGEKLFEELMTDDESFELTQHEKIFITKANSINELKLLELVNDIKAWKLCTRDVIVKRIKQLVPEFQGDEEEQEVAAAGE